MFPTPDGTDTAGGGVSGGSINPYIALLQLGGSLYDSYQNRKVSKENTNKTIAAQKSESELAYQRALNMWNQQNSYNSPEAQMERFKAAGLNPNLIYGQGSSGNASTPPQYQPANLQYRYEAPTYGSAVVSLLPTLMSVGSWMQDMRLKQVQIARGGAETDRTKQLIDFLTSRNPQLLSQGENQLSLFPYQKAAQDYNSNIARTKLFELEQSFRNQYGESLFQDMGSAWDHGNLPAIGGLKRLQFMQEQSKTKLLEAQSSWSDFDITNPQQIITMVLQGVLGMANQQMRLSTQKGVRRHP